jgi:hypothetical protein
MYVEEVKEENDQTLPPPPDSVLCRPRTAAERRRRRHWPLLSEERKKENRKVVTALFRDPFVCIPTSQLRTFFSRKKCRERERVAGQPPARLLYTAWLYGDHECIVMIPEAS